MKVCCDCKVEFPLDNFPKDKSRKDGVRSYCFPCNRKRMREVSLKRREKRHLWNKENRDSISKYNKDYYSNNKEVFQKNYKKYLKTNPQFKITHNTRVRINCALKNNFKSSTTELLLGCSLPFYKTYLENKFDNNMSWDNYGSYWDIDHIIPCINFDLSDELEQRKCFHYLNTQPLSKLENQRKNKYI